MKDKRITAVGLSLFLLISISSASPQIEEPLFPFSSFTLENGLTVILSVDKSLPLVSIVSAYKVGSSNDLPRKAGMAYLIENLMMFHGSRNIGPMQNINYLNRIGGEFNAETNADKSIFSQTVPSNQLALVLWLESDRMNSLSINESSVQQAKNSLIEEILITKTFNPYRESAVYFDQLLYANPAYSHPVIGTDINDIRDISLDDVSNFFSMYYSPNNAVVSIVGNIDIRRTTELIRKYFESIPSRKKPVPIILEKPKETSDIKEVFEHLLAASPGFYLGFRLSSPYTPDYYTLTIIDYLLLQGKSSRLYKKLLRPRIAFHLEGGIEIRKDFAVFKLMALTNEEMMKERSRRTVISEINRLRTNFVQEKELQRAKNMFKVDYLKQFETTLGKALYLANTFLEKGHLDDLFSELNKYMRITPSLVNGAMNTYFSKGSILLEIKIK
ncbi:MAG: insulinase family protein [Candidatus Aminicenantes bacterium]|nr:insulinase family protein [Candidatus Aminicenantes bacterium]